jgi:hypothetical protein
MAIDDGKKFELAREIISEENGLINQRVTWFLILQGLLFNAFVNGIGLYYKGPDIIQKTHLYATIGLIAIGVLGIIFCFLVRTVTDQAYSQIHKVASWWEAQNIKDFPPIRGPGMATTWDRVFGTHTLPIFVAIAWLVLLVLLVLSAF